MIALRKAAMTVAAHRMKTIQNGKTAARSSMM